MGLFITEIFKEQFGKEKEALEIYERETGKKVMNLYKDTFHGDNAQKGTLFEYYVFKQLYKTKGYGRFLFNMYLPTKFGTTEIDVLFIHETGIFVFECKSYSGKIYGNEKYKMWNQYFDGKKHQFYNPILQNKGHIKALKEYLTSNELENIFSFICFNSRAELKIEYDPYRMIVGNTEECILEVKKVFKKLPSKFKKEEIDSIYEKLHIYCNVSNEIKEEHVAKIKSIDR